MEDRKNMTREGMMSTCLELEAMAQRLLNRRLEVANLVAETELEDSQLMGFYLCMQRALCSEDRLRQSVADIRDTLAQIDALDMADEIPA